MAPIPALAAGGVALVASLVLSVSASADVSGAPFMISFPIRVLPGRAFKTTVVGVSAFRVYYVVKSGRRTVKRYKTKRFKAGTKTFKVRVPRATAGRERR